MKILFLDLETTPNLAHVWGLWNQNVAITQLVAPTEVLCFGARWHGSKQVLFKSVHHDGKKAMLDAMHEVMSEADIIIGWNSQSFDVKHMHREFLENGYTPPAPHKDIDLMRVVKQQFKFPSNKLDYVAQRLGIGSKTQHTGFQLWLDCMNGNDKAWRLMKRYQIQDVNLLVDLYEVLKPWIKTAVNVAAHNEVHKGCRNCGSTQLHKRGTAITGKGKYQRYQCKDCGTWNKGERLFTTTMGNV